MAVRQYIGARYVPKFSDVNDGIWNDSYTYKPLTIVKHGNDYYTSKKDVPTGVAITNTEYWVLTGNYNGAISELQDEIEDITSDVNVISSSILTMGGQIFEIEDDISELQSQLVDTEKKIIFVTDSYGTHSATNWAARTATTLNINERRIYAEGSSGFTHEGQSGHTFQTLLSSHASEVTDKNSITDIVVGGGTNDFYYFSSRSALITAIENFISYAKTTFPNAKICVCFMGYYSCMDDTMRGHYLDTIDCYSEAASSNGCAFVNAYAPMHDYYKRSDAQHPNETGNKAIANCVINYFKGSDSPYSKAQSVNSTPITSNTGTISGTPNIHLDIEGDFANVTLDTINITQTVTPTAGTSFVFARYNPDVVPGIWTEGYRAMAFVNFGANLDPVRLAFDQTDDHTAVELKIVPFITRSEVSSFKVNGLFITIPLTYV